MFFSYFRLFVNIKNNECFLTNLFIYFLIFDIFHWVVAVFYLNNSLQCLQSCSTEGDREQQTNSIFRFE